MWDKSHGLGDLPINKKAPQMQGFKKYYDNIIFSL